MLARRYMHEYGATRDHLFNVALACRNRANQNPAAIMYDRPLTREMYMTSRWISEPALPLRQLPGDRRRAGLRDRLRRAGPRLPPAARLRPLRRPGPARPAPRHGQLLERRPADRPRLDRRPTPVEARRLRPAGRRRRPDLRRVHPARSRSPWRATASADAARAPPSPRAAPWRSAAGCRSTPGAAASARRTSTASTSSTRA